MSQKLITADCINCESGFELSYMEELTSSEFPQFCPFCGESIEDIQEEYIEDDDAFEDDNWENDY